MATKKHNEKRSQLVMKRRYDSGDAHVSICRCGRYYKSKQIFVQNLTRRVRPIYACYQCTHQTKRKEKAFARISSLLSHVNE